MRIAVCIPCYITHVKYLPDLLNSIARQTRRPDIISISVSGCTVPPSAPECEIPIRFRTTTVKGSPAENRNWAAQAVLDDCDMLSFIDADDIMHSKRIEIVEKLMVASDVVYHSYKHWRGEPVREEPVHGNVKKGSWVAFPSDDPNLSVRTKFIMENKEPYAIHAAHVSVKSEIFKNTQFPLGRYRSDDSEYLNIVCRNGVQVSVSEDELSYFRIGSSARW